MLSMVGAQQVESRFSFTWDSLDYKIIPSSSLLPPSHDTLRHIKLSKYHLVAIYANDTGPRCSIAVLIYLT